jgi:hypothetical protein
MRKKLLKMCLPVAFTIFIVYHIAAHFTAIPDSIAEPACIISVILMFIAIIYHSWCFGKHINPYESPDRKTK